MSLTDQLRLRLLLLLLSLLSLSHACKPKKEQKEDPEPVEYEYDDDDETLDDVVVEGDIIVTPDDGMLNAIMTTDPDRRGKLWSFCCLNKSSIS